MSGYNGASPPTAPSTAELPVFDFDDAMSGDPAREAKAADALSLGFGHFGLVCLRNYDRFYAGRGQKMQTGKEAVSELYDSYTALLNRPEDEKRSWGGPQLWYQRGYTPPNTEVAVASGGKPDLKECYFAACGNPLDKRCQKWYPQCYAENVWPTNADDFQTQYEFVGDALHQIGNELLRYSEKSLGVPAGSFTEKAERAAHVTRILRYVELDDALAKRSADGEINWGEEHSDMNLVTVLPGGAFFKGSDRQAAGVAPPGGGAGLWLRTKPTADHPHGQKVSGTPPPGCFLAQVGQQLEVLSGGAFIATPHHIVAPTVAGWSRCAMAHFVHMRGDAVVAPVPGCKGADEDADEKYAPPVLAGTYVLKTLIDIGLAPQSCLSKLGYRNYDLLAEAKAAEAAAKKAKNC